MDVNGYRDTAQRILEHFARDEVESVQLAIEEYFELYGQMGTGLHRHLVEIGVSEAATACAQRLELRLANVSGSVSRQLEGQLEFLARVAANYAPRPRSRTIRERLLASAAT